jgi:copper transport protein
MRRLRLLFTAARGAASALVLALALVLVPAGVRAHASLLGTSPHDGAVLAAAPADLRLQFNEPVRLLALDLIGATGARIPLAGTARHDAGAIVAPLPALGEGTYLASWRIVSDDGHPVAGSLVFTVGDMSAPSADAQTLRMRTPARDDAIAAFDRAIRLVLLAAVVLAVGGVFAQWTVGPPGPVQRRVIRVAALTGAAAAVLAAGVRGALLAGDGLAGLAGPSAWTLALTTGHGRAMAAAVVGLVLIAAGGRRWSLLGCGAILLGFALSGHPASAAPRWLAAGAIVVHVAAAAAWIGALPALLERLAGRRHDIAGAIARFGRMAPAAVVALALAGIVSAAVQLDGPADLVSADYGLLVLAKVAGLGLLLGFAAWNRLRLTPLLATAPDAAVRGLVLSIRLELAAGIGVLALAAVLAATPPPRATAHDHQGHGDHVHDPVPVAGWATALAAPGVLAVVELSPALAGSNRLLVAPSRPDGSPFTPLAAFAEIGLPDHGVAPARREMVRNGDGHFVLDGLRLPVAGSWSLRIELLVTDFDLVRLTTRMPVAGVSPGERP